MPCSNSLADAITYNATAIAPGYVIVNWFYTARFWLAFGSAAFILNIFEAITIIKIKKYKSVFGVTLLSLCIADILGALSFAVCGTLRLIEHSRRETILILPNSKFEKSWKVGHAALFFALFSSFVHVLIIAIQRFSAVFFPLKFKVLFTFKGCVSVLVFAWLLCLSLSVLAFRSVVMLFLASYWITLTVNCLLILAYSAICCKTLLAVKRRRSLTIRSKSGRDGATKKVILVSLAVTVCFLVCTFVFPIYYLFVLCKWPNPMYHVVTSMIAINPFLDPLLYFYLFHGTNTIKRRKRIAPPTPRLHRFDAWNNTIKQEKI